MKYWIMVLSLTMLNTILQNRGNTVLNSYLGAYIIMSKTPFPETMSRGQAQGMIPQRNRYSAKPEEMKQ